MNKDPYPYGVHCRFSGSIGEIEDWLEENCEKGYTYNLDGVKETGSVFNQLEVVFRFVTPEDRESFKQYMRERA